MWIAFWLKIIVMQLNYFFNSERNIHGFRFIWPNNILIKVMKSIALACVLMKNLQSLYKCQNGHKSKNQALMIRFCKSFWLCKFFQQVLVPAAKDSIVQFLNLLDWISENGFSEGVLSYFFWCFGFKTFCHCVSLVFRQKEDNDV